ncbi:MAG: hypothetical protein ABIJ12_11505, partial [bacterium]
NIGLSKIVVIIITLVKIIFFIAGLWLLAKSLKYENHPVGRNILVFGSTLVVALVIASNALSRDNWAEFKTQIISSDVQAGTKIYISDLAKKQDGDSWGIVIDLNSGADRKNSFNVKVGDEEVKLVGGKGILLDMFYPKPTYFYYSEYIPIGIEEYRQYAIIPAQEHFIWQMLDKNGYLDISVSINDDLNEPNNFINLWGRLSNNSDSTFIPGIRFVSIERFVHQNDPRIRYPVKFASDSAFSYYINPSGKINENDLSPSPGIQTGRYNIFLILFKKDGDFIVY